MDLALIVDGSAIVTQSDPGDYRRFLAFLRDLVSKFDLRSGHARVAAVVFGDVGQVVFYLDTFNTRVCVQKALSKALQRKIVIAAQTRNAVNLLQIFVTSRKKMQRDLIRILVSRTLF